MMQQLKWMLNGALVIMAFCLIVTLAITTFNEMQPVRADLVIRPAIPYGMRSAITVDDENAQYLRLTDALPRRDITTQRFAPLEVNP